MFHIKLTARPDARMVEIPLDIEVELPREFDGAAVLAASGMPRKVRLRAPKDAIKLSTAYRADQLVADLVRLALRGTPQDVQRAQEATAAFLKTARERRQDGAAILVESNGRGRIDVVELAPRPMPSGGVLPAGPARPAASPIDNAALTTLTERVAILERSLATLEARFMASPHAEPSERALRVASEQLERRIDHRLADLEEQLAAAQKAGTQMVPRPAPAPREPVRRATAVEAFADGLRSELKLRSRALAQAALDRANLCNKAAQLAVDAQQSSGQTLPASSSLTRLASEATARSNALSRIAGEVDLYAAAEIPIASQLLDRITRGEAEDPLPLLRLIAEEGWLNGTINVDWLAQAAALYGWTVISPKVGDPFDPALHDLEGLAGETIEELLAPGVRDAAGAVLMPARVRARPRAEDLLSELDPAALVPLDSAPPPAAATDASADDEWDRVAQGPDAFDEPLASPLDDPLNDAAAPLSAPQESAAAAAPAPAETTASAQLAKSGALASDASVNAADPLAPISEAHLPSAKKPKSGGSRKRK